MANLTCGDCIEWVEDLTDDTIGACQHEDSPHYNTERRFDAEGCPFGYTWEDVFDPENHLP